MSSNPLLNIQNVSVNYGAINAVDSVSLTVDEGEIVALIGANGAGKSSLMMSLYSQPRITSGKIYFDQQRIDNLPTHKVSSAGIAISPEGRRIFPAMTTEENLFMGALLDQSKTEAQLNYVYSIFPKLLERKSQRAGTMSGGEQQMLAIGRALMCQPKLLLLDEPSLGLAPIIVKQIFTVLRQIADTGTTIFLVEQNANHALSLADRGYVMVNGAIHQEGTGDELLQDESIRDAYLGTH